MLVHSKIPRGVLYLEGYQIWGKETKQPPKDIPWEVYRQCRDALEDATYRERYLSKLFGKPFPMVAFTYGEIRFLPEKTLNNIGPIMIPDFKKSWSHKKKVDTIKIAIRDKSPCH